MGPGMARSELLDGLSHLVGGHDSAFFLVNVTSQHLAEIAILIDGGTRVGAVLTPRRTRARLISCWKAYGLTRKESSCLLSEQVEQIKTSELQRAWWED